MNAAPTYEQALALYRQGQYANCLDCCDVVLTAHPNDAGTTHLVGMLCFIGGDPGTALEWFDKALALRPDWSEAISNRGLALKNLGRIEESLVEYRRALALDPEDAQAHSNFGVALRQLGEIEEAVAAFRRAVELNPMVSGGYTGLGLALAELGQSEEAVTALKQAVAAFPHLEAPYRNLAAETRRLGRLDEAIESLRWGVAVHGLAKLGRELALFLEENGEAEAAHDVLSGLVAKHPDSADGWEALGGLEFRLHHFGGALTAFERTVELDASRADAHMRIYTVAQILENKDLALRHQAVALQSKRLFTESGTNPQRPQLLILKAAGDWQANLPTDFILRAADWGALHHYYIDPAAPPHVLELPFADAVFSAVAEPDLTRDELAVAAEIIADLALPAFNQPERVARTGRADIAALLADLPGAIVPPCRRIACPEAEAAIDAALASGELALPLLIRPVGTHAGFGLRLVNRRSELDEALAALGDADAAYVTNFVDYSGEDGQFRKYRVVVVDGEPYPFHMALSQDWMVHYYNARPLDPAAMDREEARFLLEFDQVFPEAARDAFAAMHERLGLDFFGVDCGLSREGKLILFEVDVGIIIHLMDDPTTHPWKHQAVPRIFAALRELIEARIADPALEDS